VTHTALQVANRHTYTHTHTQHNRFTALESVPEETFTHSHSSKKVKCGNKVMQKIFFQVCTPILTRYNSRPNFVQIGQCLVEIVISRFLVRKIMVRILPTRPYIWSSDFGPPFTR